MIFKPQDEIYFLYPVFMFKYFPLFSFTIRKTSTLKCVYKLNFKKGVRKDISENTENMFHYSEKHIKIERKKTVKKHNKIQFIYSFFLYISCTVNSAYNELIGTFKICSLYPEFLVSILYNY
jgi:hypothetical protein